MKYQTLVSSTTPSSLREWFQQELEDRDIDSVFARYILSLLQLECVDVESLEYYHVRNRPQKGMQKYGGPANLMSAAKSKHQKWKTWGKQFSFTPPLTRYNAKSYDLERIKKQVAIDCLRSASDYTDDIQELVEELSVRLKNIKSLKAEKEDMNLRSVKKSLKVADAFFIPPSSPTDEVEKYFAAFPSLDGKSENITDLSQSKTKNLWCGRCIKKSISNNGNALKYDNLNITNVTIQPILPLKPIKDVYKRKYVPDSASDAKKASDLVNINIKNDANNDKLTDSQMIALQAYLTTESLQAITCKFIPPVLYKGIVTSCPYLSELRFNDTFLTETELKNFLSVVNVENILVVFNFNLLDFHGLNVAYVVSCIDPTEFSSHSNEPCIAAFGENLILSVNLNNAAISTEKKDFSSVVEDSNSYIEKHFTLSSLSDLLDYNPQKFDKLDYDENLSLYRSFNESKLHYTKKSTLLDFEKKLSNGQSDIIECSGDEMYYSDSDSCNESFRGHEQAKHCYAMREFINPSTSMETYNANSFPEPGSFLPNDQRLNTCFKVYSEPKIISSSLKGYGQKLLKKVLNIGKVIAMSSLNSSIKPLCSTADKSTVLINTGSFDPSFQKQDISRINKSASTSIITPFINGEFENNSSERRIISKDVLIDKTSEKRWILHWGDVHNIISNTWQGELSSVNVVETINPLLNNSTMTSYFCAEINKDGDELLKIVDSLRTVHESTFTYNVAAISFKSSFTAFDFSCPSKDETSLCIQIPNYQLLSNDSIAIDKCEGIDKSSCTFENIGISDFSNELSNDDNISFCYNYNSCEEVSYNYHGLSAFSCTKEAVPYSESYICGGWSLSSDNFPDYICDNPYEESYPPGGLDFEKGEESVEAFHHRRRCISEVSAESVEKTNKDSSRMSKHKTGYRKRPCLYFLEGNCSDDDCNYLHDFSATTCRFWKEGSCFKGLMCPFLHGYATRKSGRELLKERRYTKSTKLDLKFSLKSEVDFPSLSSTPPLREKKRSDPGKEKKQTKEKQKF